MAMRYQKATVLWTYHHDKPGSYEPSVDQLEDWDDELAEFYDLKLDQEMLAAGIPVTKATRSQIVALAEVSNGCRSEIDAHQAALRGWKGKTLSTGVTSVR